MLRRYLLLTLLDLVMNWPEQILRLLSISGIVDHSSLPTIAVVGTARLLFYSQYSINILYLWVFRHYICSDDQQQTNLSTSIELKFERIQKEKQSGAEEQHVAAADVDQEIFL